MQEEMFRIEEEQQKELLEKKIEEIVAIAKDQGYITYGFELNPFIFFRGLNIQYAVYKTETGNQIGDRPDRRKVLQIYLGF